MDTMFLSHRSGCTIKPVFRFCYCYFQGLGNVFGDDNPAGLFINVVFSLLQRDVANLPLSCFGLFDCLVFLIKEEIDERSCYEEPIETIADNRSNGRSVVPAKNSIEDLPATGRVVFLRIAPRNVPNCGCDLVPNDISTLFSSFAADDLVPGILLKEADAFGQESCRHEVQNGSSQNEEPAKLDKRAASVDNSSDQASANESHNHSDRDRLGLSVERNLQEYKQSCCDDLEKERERESLLLLTPPINTTASRPSRKTVMKGNKKKE